MSDPHPSLIRTPKQLVIVIVLAFIVPIALIVMISQLVTSHSKGTNEGNEEAVLRRIKPVGTLAIAEAGAGQAPRTGQQVVQALCAVCHGPGTAGAPRTGDKTAWAPLIRQGYDTLVDHALKGNQHNGATMPPKGGDAELQDLEVARAVAFLANQAGANFQEPEAKPTPASAAVAAASPPGAQTTAARNGKAIYDTTCAACHGTGVAGAPKAGDKAAWAPRLKTGMTVLYNSALKGKNAMPAKGGNTSLSDADVKAAVDYLAGLAK